MNFIIGFIIGAVLGSAVALIAGMIRAKNAKEQMREAFSALAGEALDANSRRLSEQSGAALESKKELIDQSVKAIDARLNKMGEYFQRLESERKKEFGELSSSVGSLANTTGKLHEMLASTQRRGAWGERMAEDILNLAGLQEGVNYRKQSGDAAESGRPDFTFLLPNDVKANMDVKFPLESYKKYLDCDGDGQQEAALKNLVTTVKNHVRAVASRGYIDPNAPTVPYVIVFLASEHMFSLVLEANPDLIDEALQRKVVLASPLTLYAMLSVMRQAAEHHNLMKTADEVISLLQDFTRQWESYGEEFDKLGSQLETVVKTYDRLRTTRTNQLTKPLDKIEQLRQTRDELPQG